MANKVILCGRLGADPESRAVGDGQLLTTCTMATSEKWKDKNGQQQEKTEWHRLTFWGPIGDVIGKYGFKGQRLYIEGKLTTQKKEDDQGQARYFTSVSVRELEMLSFKDEQQGNNKSTNQNNQGNSGSDRKGLKNHAPGDDNPSPRQSHQGSNFNDTPSFDSRDEIPF